MYLICSGYGLYKSYIDRSANSSKPHIARIGAFLLNYWMVMVLIAIPYLAISGKFELKYLPVNLFALLHNDQMLYVSFSWYVKLYLLILLIVPIMKRLNHGPSRRTILFEFGFYVALPYLIHHMFYQYIRESEYIGFPQFLFSSLLLLIQYLPIFYAGVFLAKYNILEKIKQIIKWKKPWLGVIVCIGMLAAILCARNYFHKLGTEFIYATLFIICCSMLLDNIQSVRLHRLLLFVGKHSFWYWMLSGMFFLNTSELQWILFIPYHWLAIIVWTFLILTPAAMLLEKFSEIILTFWGRIGRKRLSKTGF